MSVIPLQLKDLSGGLNLRDPRSSLPPNQASELKNYLTDGNGLLDKRLGQKLLQYAPIDPQLFVNDASTLAHYAFDEAGATAAAIDSSGNGRNLAVPALASMPSTVALFPVGAGLGRQSTAQSVIAGSTISSGGCAFDSIGASIIDGATALTMRGWVNIPPSFNGAPITLTNNFGTVTFSNSGALLFGTAVESLNYSLMPGNLKNGFRLWRDWDSVNSQNGSDPYVTFTLNTNGVAGTVTTVRSSALPLGRMLELEGRYDSGTSILEIYVNGNLHDRIAVVGGGTVDDTLGYFLAAFGSQADALGGFAPNTTLVSTCAGVIMDEWELSNVVRTGFPFKKPRGRGMVLSKADGTNQIIAAAEEGLYWTVLDGTWTKIQTNPGAVDPYSDPATDLPLSSVADWDGVLINDRLYLTNGVNTPLTWDGTRLVPTGEAAKPLTLGLSAGGSTHTNGLFKYVYTFMYGDLDETGFSPIATQLVAGNKDVNISDILSRMENCTGIRIYRTKAGGTQYFLMRELVNDSEQTSFSLTGPWTSAGAPDLDTGADGLPDGSTPTDLNDDSDYPEAAATVAAIVTVKAQIYLAAHNRLMKAKINDRPYDLCISALGNPDVFRMALFVAVPTDKGFIVALMLYYNDVHISLNAKATNVLSGSDESNWALTINLHPDVGARDHWSWAHRYPVGDAGPYTLCFAGLDGEYVYNGQQIKKVSDELNPLFEEFSVVNESRQVWLTTNQADFQSGVNQGGSATANVQASHYEQDGLRETPGQAKVVDQFNPIGLWTKDLPLVTGNVIAMAKGVAEGEFWFSQDSDNLLYHTLDNFQTVANTYAVGVAGVRIIEVIKQGAADVYFLITDTAGAGIGSAGGSVWSYDNGSNSVTMLNAATIFHEVDVPFKYSGVLVSFRYALGYPGYTPTNLNINHAQSLFSSRTGSTGVDALGIFSGPSARSSASVLVATQPAASYPIGTGIFGPTIAAGNYAVGAAPNPFEITFTRREFPLWRGGSHRPQAFWDATNNKLWFLGASAEDVHGNRPNQIYSLTAAGALVVEVAGQAGVLAYTALAFDGNLSAYYLAHVIDTAFTGTQGSLRKLVLAASAVSNLGNYSVNHVSRRLSFNANSSKLLAIGQAFPYVKDAYDYVGTIANIDTATATQSTLKQSLSNFDVGAYPVELVYQTDTPFRWHVVMQSLTVADPTLLYYVAPAAALPTDVVAWEAAAYTSPTSSDPTTGVRSNLLFVPASMASGNYLWADRLYWMASAAAVVDARLLQLGVEGTWEVHGELVSKQNSLGDFDAFGNLVSDFNGNVGFFLRSAATAGVLAASELGEVPNQAITGFAVPGAWAQWRILLTWSYSVANPTVSPFVKSVLIEYFLGTVVAPRPVGIHWKGRTYMAYARNGQPENDVVVVYDKKNAFTMYEGWNIKGFFKFKGMLCSFQGYDLVELEAGSTDMGKRIDGTCRTGVIAGETTASLQEVQANVAGSLSQYYPNANGYVEIVPMAGDDELTGIWAVALPPSGTKEIRRSYGQMPAGFEWSWGQAFSMLIRTSKQLLASGYAAQNDQQETIAELDLKLATATSGRNYVGK